MACVDVNGPGMVVPLKTPNSGDAASGPLYMYKSSANSTSNSVKVTVTASPAVSGKNVVV